MAKRQNIESFSLSQFGARALLSDRSCAMDAPMEMVLSLTDPLEVVGAAICPSAVQVRGLTPWSDRFSVERTADEPVNGPRRSAAVLVHGHCRVAVAVVTERKNADRPASARANSA